MKEEKLFESIANIDEKYVAEARATTAGRKKPIWTRWAVAAACLCFAIGTFFAVSSQKEGNRVQIWDDSYSPKQYFKHADEADGNTSASSLADCEILYAEARRFSDDRALLESENVIPVMDTHPLFFAEAHYNSDGSLIRVVLSWHRRDADGLENYSDLTVTAGYEEVSQVDDCIAIELDDKGNIVEPGVTVTERDGIRIVAVGSEDQKKTITFQNDNGWYQIEGSWNDRYEDMVELLDWFWEHPIEFSRFSMDAGDQYTSSSLLKMPDTFSAYLPNFQTHGFIYETSEILLKNGEPVSLEAHYVSNATKEQVMNSEYKVGENGCTTVHWCIETNPDVYEIESCIGELEELTREQILSLKPADDITTETKVKFMQDGNVITVYASDIHQAWKLIESIREK